MSKRINQNIISMKESPLFWPTKLKGEALHVLDETQIPFKMHFIKVHNTREAVLVIKQMKTRAFGQLLVVLNTFLLEIKNHKNISQSALFNKLKRTAESLNNSRPTFPFCEVTSMVVSWAKLAYDSHMDIGRLVQRNIAGYLKRIRERRLERVRHIAGMIKSGDSILTHCNVSGELAMAAYLCQRQGKDINFFATETRPYLQGSKLTSWELKRMGADVTLIADNAVGTVMADGLVNKVIVGSDRSCANGDFANKIGTYQIAVLAKEFNIPFYVLTQPSEKIKRGEDIPIEIRNANELLMQYKKKIVSGIVGGFYPGFDVIPNRLITKKIPIDVH